MTNRRDKIFKLAKGYSGRSKNNYKLALNRVEHALQHAYRARKNRKRIMRKLWITNLNAACREFGIKYSQFVHGLVLGGCALNRKTLSELAKTEPMTLRSIVELSTQSRKIAIEEQLQTKFDEGIELSNAKKSILYELPYVAPPVFEKSYKPKEYSNDDEIPYDVDQKDLAHYQMKKINQVLEQLKLEEIEEDKIMNEKLDKEMEGKKFGKEEEYPIGDV